MCRQVTINAIALRLRLLADKDRVSAEGEGVIRIVIRPTGAVILILLLSGCPGR